MAQQINVANVKMILTEVQMGAYLKSEVHCINSLFWCWVKAFGPRWSLARKCKSASKSQKGTNFLPGAGHVRKQ